MSGQQATPGLWWGIWPMWSPFLWTQRTRQTIIFQFVSLWGTGVLMNILKDLHYFCCNEEKNAHKNHQTNCVTEKVKISHMFVLSSGSERSHTSPSTRDTHYGPWLSTNWILIIPLVYTYSYIILPTWACHSNIVKLWILSILWISFHSINVLSSDCLVFY